jgi:hypothetical protein
MAAAVANATDEPPLRRAFRQLDAGQQRQLLLRMLTASRGGLLEEAATWSLERLAAEARRRVDDAPPRPGTA